MKSLIKIIILLSVCAGVFTAAYIYTGADTFPSGSKINGIRVGGLTASEAADKLTDYTDFDEVSIIIDEERAGKIKPCYKIDKKALGDDLNALIKQGRIKPSVWYKLHKGYSFSVPFLSDNSDKTVQKTLKELLENKYSVKTSNACVDYNNLKIIKEVYGTELDYEKLEGSFKDNVSKGKGSFIAESKDYMIKPTVFSDDESLVKELEFAKTYLKGGMRVNIGNEKVDIPLDKLRWIIVPYEESADISSDGSIKLAKWLKKNYSSDGKVTMTLHGKKYTLNDYGNVCDMNVSKTSDSLSAAAQDKLDGKDTVADVFYTSDGLDYTKNYIEVDITNQKLYFYKNGKLRMSTDVVTGRIRHSTPTGAFSILWKETNATLRGREDDGSKYASKVSYWMPISDSGVGLHDATWRYSFGGGIYTYNGSHGCVNMPFAKAQYLFNHVDAGYPVFIYKSK